MSGDVDQNLAAAEREAGRMKDEYVSVEHIMMAVLEKPNTGMSRIFQQFGVTKDQFLSVLATVRAIPGSPATPRRKPMIPCPNTARIWWSWRKTTSWTR